MDGALLQKTQTAQLGGPKCRPIEESDLDAVADLLTRGFEVRSRDYWRRGLEIMRLRPCPEGQLRYGVVLDHGGELRGVLLTLFTPGRPDDQPLCQLSSWYIDPEYRHLALHLDKAATRLKSATYLNISPAPNTRNLIGALGYKSLNEDTVLALPWLGPLRPGAHVATYDSQTHDALFVDPRHARLCADHQPLDCWVLVATERGKALPFILQRKPLPGLPLGAAHVIYTPSMDDLVRLAGPLGRAMIRRGVFLWKLDGDVMPAGLAGRKITGRSARWAKGDHPPGPNDLSYSELVVFGP